MNAKLLLTYLFIFLGSLFLHGQDLVFSYDVVTLSPTTSKVEVYVQKNTAGQENLAGFTVDFYYDNAESTITSFNTSPLLALGWAPLSNSIALVPNNNITITINHTGYGEINVIDGNGLGSMVGTTPIRIVTLYFDHSIGTMAASAGYMASTILNGHIALAYTNTSFGEYPVVVIPGEAAQPLPILLSYFSAYPLNSTDVQLDWVTAGEINSSRFDVERSINGKEWKKIKTVAAAGNSAIERTYTMVDEKVFNPKASGDVTFYYRLKMADLNGSFEYSDVRQASFNGQSLIVGEIFPNPAGLSSTYVQLPVSSLEDSDILIDIYDSRGMKVTSNKSSVSRGNNNLRIGTGYLSTGIYHIRLSMLKGGTYDRKLVVQ